MIKPRIFAAVSLLMPLLAQAAPFWGSNESRPPETPPAELKPGDPAPEFSLAGSDGKTHRLSDYKGKQAVVLAWFPKAFTGG